MKKLSILVMAALLCCMTACEKDKNEPSQPSTGIENGYAWVDLGLSVKWATCNVGASNPEDYGNYFAWGETSPKSYYDESTYKYCKGKDGKMTKYGIVDDKTILELIDDAAHVNWGGAWRMPTRAEQDELRNNCTWTWTTQNGVKGYQIKGKNGKSIFLPAAGVRGESRLVYVGSSGTYWSSSLYTSNLSHAYYLDFDSGSVTWSYDIRYEGLSVRPVCP